MNNRKYLSLIEPFEIINVIRTTLSRIDPRLIGHGDRVAFIAREMLEYAIDAKILDNSKNINKNKLFVLCELHDVGAYKTDEVDDMVSFDGTNPYDHAVYGYIFLKNMSPLGGYSEAILYHHTPFSSFDKIDSVYKDYAAVIYFADRVDILTLSKSGCPYKDMYSNAGTLFDPELCTLFEQADKARDIVGRLHSGEYINAVNDYIKQLDTVNSDIFEYLKMLVYAIDFRSEHTVTHSVNTTSISLELAEYLGLSEEDKAHIYQGAFLHDLGKIAIPVHILEKPGKLTDEEMDIMRTHVIITDEILGGVVNDEIRKIAIRHHEKLNGRGYPYGIAAEDLTMPQRIVAVADILSALNSRRSYKDGFPKEKVISIIESMRDNGELDKAVCDAAIENYDKIIADTEKVDEPVITLYKGMIDEYNTLLPHIRQHG